MPLITSLYFLFFNPMWKTQNFSARMDIDRRSRNFHRDLQSINVLAIPENFLGGKTPYESLTF